MRTSETSEEEFIRLKRMIANEYSGSASDDNIKFEAWRLLRVPKAGAVRLPSETHPALECFQKIMLDLTIIYRMGYCELTILSCRALLEAFAKTKIGKYVAMFA